jgi:O-antigen ligase
MAARELSLAMGLALLSRRLLVTGLLLCAAALFGIVELGSRGALLGWLAFLAIGFALCRDRRRLLLLGLGATALSFALVWGLAQEQVLGADSLLNRAQQGGLAASTGRLSLWSDVLRAILVHPWWGYGPDGHRVIDCCGHYGRYVAMTSQPHNLLLQLLEDVGIVGAALSGALACGLVRGQTAGQGWLELARAQPDLALLLSALGGLLVFGLVDGPFYHPVSLIIATTLAALAMASARRATRSAPP